MAAKNSILFLLVLALAVTVPAHAQTQTTPVSQSDAPVLTLDDAVSFALANNRVVKNSNLEVQKLEFSVSTARTRRLPQFQFAVLGGELLHSFDFTIPAGSLGTYGATGPIPANDAKIHTPAQFTTYGTAAFDQPLTQQYKIGLGIRMTELTREIAREDVRAERQRVAAEVRTAYFQLVATQAGVDAARETVNALEEAKKITALHRVEETVLQADVLEVDARLAKSRYALAVAENGLVSQREHLNELLGRDLNTTFRVDPIPTEEAEQSSLDEARHQAAENRAEIRQALLREKQAETDRRLAKAEYIPDLSLSVRYQGINNVQVLPANVATAGFLLTWEPFDWGRRHNNVSEKSKVLEQARNATRETEDQIAVEVGAKYRKLQETVLLLKAAHAEHQAAAEQFRVTTTKYKEQAALIRDVLQAQARSTETEFQYEQALSSYWASVAELRRAMGEE